MRIHNVLWDDDTVEHLAHHGVRPEEAEEVCQIRPYALRTHHGRYAVLGQTRLGRYLTIIVAPLGQGRAKIVTARAMTDAERKRYLQR